MKNETIVAQFKVFIPENGWKKFGIPSKIRDDNLSQFRSSHTEHLPNKK
jgi:hypothetical protein